MNAPHPVSVIITTFNEEKNLGAALESVRWADERIVVDSFSTDATPDIARQYGCTLLQRAYKGPADQKNWAIPRATHEWILLLDADERLTPELEREIRDLLARDEIPFDAFWIRRQSFFMEKKVRYSGWQGDRVVRLFRRDRCRYDDKQVHEEIMTEGLRTGTLRAPMEHHTFSSMDHFLEKMQRYARWSAMDHMRKTPRVTYFHLWLKPAFRFFYHFVIRLGFLDGHTGFIISAIMAWGVFLRYAHLEAMRREQARN